MTELTLAILALLWVGTAAYFCVPAYDAGQWGGLAGLLWFFVLAPAVLVRLWRLRLRDQG